MKKKIINIILVIIVMFSIFLIKNRKDFFNTFQEELIFFKLLSSKNQIHSNQEIEKYKRYNFKVSYKDIKLKNINLLETIDKKTLIHEKIAPRNKRWI